MSVGDTRSDGRRIVVGVSGSLASLAALRHATALARREEAELLAVLAWEPPEGEALFARAPDRAWERMWGEAARLRLDRAFEEALGAVPGDLRVVRRVVRDAPVAALCAAAVLSGDLLVLGRSSGRGRLGRWRPRPVLRSVLRSVLHRGRCPVLIVPGPVLLPGEARALRRSAENPVPDGAGTGSDMELGAVPERPVTPWRGRP
ncbi:universal stress protein [Streptomyces sp. NPDC046712]|uniref:universal stress protein n=1 Tax=Streptomyces sp. NPDC046712 TaxID=3154802 RepID=UPI0033C32113